MKKNRSTLKDYFKKGAIPTDANFADLIDSMLNQEEDNINQLPNDALSITASGIDEALLNFYRRDQNESKLTWQVKQNLGGKAGLSINDIVASRLFIENSTGNLGVGTTTPGAKLQVVGSQDRVALRVGWGDTSGNEFTMDIAGGQGMANLVAGAKIKPDGSGYTFLGTRGAARIGLHDGTINFHTSDATNGTANADAVGLTSGSAKMVLTNAGRLGVGTTGPATQLEVSKMAAGAVGGTLRISNPAGGGGTQSALEFTTFNVGSNPAGARILATDNSNYSADIDFQTKVSGAAANALTTRMKITGDGNVGIATAPGDYRLNVAGNALFTGNYLYVNSESAGRLRVGAAWGIPGLYSGDDGDKDLILGVNANRKVYLGVSTGDAYVEGGTGNAYFKGYAAARQVYFSAYLDSNSRSGAQNPLPMQVASQIIGNCYDTNTSKFTAPVKGVYLFTMTGCRVEGTDWLHWYLMVNGGYPNSGGTNSNESTERCILSWYAAATTNTVLTHSRTIILSLNANDTVWVQQTGTGRCDNFRSGFEGLLLSASV